MFKQRWKIIIVLAVFLVFAGCTSSTQWTSYLSGRNLTPFDKSFLQIFKDDNDGLWAISYSGNLLFYDQASDKWIQKLTPEELGLGVIPGLAKGGGGLIWGGSM